MSDTALTPAAAGEMPQEPTLGARIIDAPEELWKKIKAALGATTREEAASLVEQDEKAASIALSILDAPEEPDTALTSRSSAASSAPAPRFPSSPSAPSRQSRTAGAANVRF